MKLGWEPPSGRKGRRELARKPAKLQRFQTAWEGARQGRTRLVNRKATLAKLRAGGALPSLDSRYFYPCSWDATNTVIRGQALRILPPDGLGGAPSFALSSHDDGPVPNRRKLPTIDFAPA